MKIDWKLKGSNLLKFCCNKSSTVHPETCSDAVMIEHDSSQSLKDWITNNGTTPIGTSLSDWITQSFLKTEGDDIKFVVESTYTPAEDIWDTTNSFRIGTINTDYAVRIPYGNLNTYGVFKLGNGLTVTNDGVLSIGAATNNYCGGIKLGYTPSPNTQCVPVQLDSNYRAYVDLSTSASESVIYKWNANIAEHTTTTPVINPSAYIVNEGDDDFASIDIYNYKNVIEDLFANPVNKFKIYPIRTDIKGHLYTFVPWENTSYDVYDNTKNGLVPYDSRPSLNTTGFLAKDGTWKVPSYRYLLDTPTVFSSTSSGLVPAAAGQYDTGKFLKGDGTWDTPQDTTYDTAVAEAPQGLLVLDGTFENAECDMILPATAPIAANKQMVPVLWNSNAKAHGVVLNMIIDALVENPDLLAGLLSKMASAVGNDQSLKTEWNQALA